jgi:lipid A 3-O-deacylase
VSRCGEIREPSRLIGLAVTLAILAFACGSADTMATQSWDFGERLLAVSEELRKAPTQVTLQLDNDSYLIHGTDRFYTNGTHLIVRFPLSPQPHASGERHDTYGWRLGQDIYTPANAGNAGAQLGPSNRPFAAWLYLGVFRETVLTDGRDAQFWRFGLDIGCLGPCAHGEQTQNTVHRVSGADQAIGWETQVRNGLGVQLNAQ